MYTKLHLLSVLGAALPLCSAQAVLLTVTDYTYNTAPDSVNYPDSTGTELNDGITDTIVWGTANPADIKIGPLVGWFGTKGDITFNFASSVNVNSVTLWFADSDGVAGVDIPDSIKIYENGITDLGDFSLTNPSGSGTTVPLTVNGLNAFGSSIRIELNRDTQWTMLSEVQFDGAVVPEPSTYAAILGVLAVGYTIRRRCKGKK